MRFLAFLLLAGGCASHERPDESMLPPPPPGTERGWLVMHADNPDSPESWPQIFFPDSRSDAVAAALGRCHTTEAWDPREVLAALGGERVDWPSELWGQFSKVIGPRNLPVDVMIVARADVVFAPTPSGGLRRVESNEIDRCAAAMHFGGCAANLEGACVTETTEGAEVVRSIVFTTAIMAADESRLTIDGIDETGTTTYRAELALRPESFDGGYTGRRWPGSAVDGVALTITEPDGTTVRFDRFGPLWTAQHFDGGPVQSFWIDARTGPEPNARRLRWIGDADLTYE